MSNIFLFRHGEYFASDSSNEKLTSLGIEQAEKAGEFIADKLNIFYDTLKKRKKGFKELYGLLKVHSGRPRTLSFLEIMSNVANDRCNIEELGFDGDKIKIDSSDIYRKGGEKKILEIINQCSPFTGIQLIVGHNPQIAKVANYYANNGFYFKGDKMFLNATLEGGGYWINTSEQKIETINQSQ